MPARHRKPMGGYMAYDEALALEIGPAIAGSRIYLPAAFNGNDDR